MKRFTLFSHLWFRLLYRFAALAAFLALTIGTFVNAWNGVPMHADFPTLHSSVVSAREGGDLFRPFIYAPVLNRYIFVFPPHQTDHTFITKNLNAPIVSALLYPLAALSVRQAYYTLCGFQLLCSILLLWRIFCRLLPPQAMPLTSAVLAVCAYFPLSMNMLLGQIGILPFLAIGAGWLLLQRQAVRSAGILFGLAVVIKLFAGLLFIWFALQRRWLLCAWGVLAWVGAMSAGLMLFGVQNHLDWLRALHNIDWGTETWNASLYGVASRYFGGTIMPGMFESPWGRWAVHSLGLCGAAATLIHLSRRKAPGAFDVGFAACLPMMLLLTPLGWIYYFPLLFLSGALLFYYGSTTSRTLAGLGLFFSAVPQMLGRDEHPTFFTLRVFHLGIDTVAPDPADDFRWFMMPDVYPIALVLLILAALLIKNKELQTTSCTSPLNQP